MTKKIHTDLEITGSLTVGGQSVSGGGLQQTLFDTKGDLIVASAADTAARLPAGTNGQVLTADSAESTGLKWTTSTASTLDVLGDVTSASAIAGDGLIFSSAANSYSASTTYVAGASGVVLTSSRSGFGSPSDLPDVGGGAHRLDGNGNWVRWDFGTPTMISGFKRSGIHPSNYATSIRIDYSDDGLTWTQLQTFSGLTTAGGHLDLTEITHSARFWRYVLLTSSNGTDELDAFQLALTTQTPIGSSQWVPQKYPTLLENLANVSDTAPSSGNTLIYTSSNVYWPSVTYLTGATITSNGTGFGTPGTLDVTDGSSHRLDGTGNWVKWDFGTAKRLSGFRRYAVHSSKYATSIKIQYSDNDSAWTDLQTFTGLQPGTCQLDFTDKSQNHRYWRYVNVADTGTGDEMDAFHFAQSVADTTSAQWTPSPNNGITQTLIDAKGDLIVGSAADTAARLAAGTNGQVLVADSTQGTGLKWANPTAPSQAEQIDATGGDITLENGYRIHTFRNAGSFVVNSIPASSSVDYIVVGGGSGGSGGLSGTYYGAGGAGGIVRAGSTNISVQTYTITVGTGGAGAAIDGGASGAGGSSSFAGVTATGGSAVTSASRDGGDNADYFGFDVAAGINAGGGAGAGGSATSNIGGPGFSSSITGVLVDYGVGGTSSSGAGVASAPISGKGGDGTGGGNTGRAGGSGVVIIRYPYTYSSSADTDQYILAAQIFS